MPVVHLDHARGRTPIHVGAGLLGQAEILRGQLSGRVLVVSDETVAGLHRDRLAPALEGRLNEWLVLPPGESAKTLANWRRALDALVELGAQRDATVVAFGGGVVGDLAGFAAACYMRGIRSVQVPTTLLAQVDAAIGGKTGVNHPAGKNLIGAFHQPALVIADIEVLETLPGRDYRAGLAEVVKYGAIREAGFLDWLEARAAALERRDPETLAEAVRRAVVHKVEVVMADELEAGGRALLNFGHTFGHALETATDYRRFRHGEAVAIGMVLAARLSAALGRIGNADAGRLETLLSALGLPTRIPGDLDPDQLLEIMRLDKKNRGEKLYLVLLDAPGRARLDGGVEPQAVREVLAP